MPCSHTMEPHFIPDAYCAMKASSKKELDDIWSVCHPGCPAIHSAAQDTAFALKKSSRHAYSCMQPHAEAVLRLLNQ